MIHWTRQIKEVLSSQDALQTAENAGPLEEIQFWKNRCADLSGISAQLDKGGVKNITHILQLAKSSYVSPFLRLSSQIKVTDLLFLYHFIYHLVIFFDMSLCRNISLSKIYMLSNGL